MLATCRSCSQHSPLMLHQATPHPALGPAPRTATDACTPCPPVPPQSYYGAMLCCTFSPCGRYIATGGEDDLVSLYGLAERQVLAWGECHSSWVARVAFDTQLPGTLPGGYRLMPGSSTEKQYRCGAWGWLLAALWRLERTELWPAGRQGTVCAPCHSCIRWLACAARHALPATSPHNQLSPPAPRPTPPPCIPHPTCLS
jgi:hypothetical protein